MERPSLPAHAMARKQSPRRTVLVVDDDPSVRRLLDRALRKGEFHVHAVMDIGGAMDALVTRRFVAVVLDMLFVNSAGRSGLDVLRHIRSTPLLKDLPVVVLTGFVLNKAIVAEVESLGAELWSKPISPRALVERLNTLVSGSPPR